MILKNKESVIFDTKQKLKRENEIPVTPEFWKDHLLQVVREAGEEGINRENLREKTRKSIGLGFGYYNRLDKLIDELVQERLIVESKTDHFKVI